MRRRSERLSARLSRTEPMEVLVRNLQALPVGEELLVRAANEAARVGVAAADAPSHHLPDTIGIALVDDRRISELNSAYLGREGPTDVIAFEAEDEPEARSGEVIVSSETAVRQAAEYGQSLERELCLLVSHGVLHVLGYEDYDDEARARMNDLSERVLAALEGGGSDGD